MIRQQAESILTSPFIREKNPIHQSWEIKEGSFVFATCDHTIFLIQKLQVGLVLLSCNMVKCDMYMYHWVSIYIHHKINHRNIYCELITFMHTCTYQRTISLYDAMQYRIVFSKWFFFRTTDRVYCCNFICRVTDQFWMNPVNVWFIHKNTNYNSNCMKMGIE